MNNANETTRINEHARRLPKAEKYKDGSYKRARGCSKQDPLWYARDDHEINLLGSLPYVEAVGDALPGAFEDVVPGFMKLRWIPTFPWTPENGSATLNNFNTAADKAFQALAQGFSTDSLNFEGVDVIMTMLAACQFRVLLDIGKRAFGFRKHFSNFNEYWAENVTTALGIQYSDLKRKQAEFVESFNLLVEQFNDVCAIPEPFFIGDRWAFLSQHVFADSDAGDYTTLFAAVPTKILVLDPYFLSTGTCLRWKTVPEAMTVEQYFDLCDSVYATLRDPQFRDIFSWIRRVYSSEQLFKYDPIPEGFEIEIHRNDVIAAAVHNMTTVTDIVGNLPTNITPAGTNWRFTDVCVYQVEGKMRVTNYACIHTGSEPRIGAADRLGKVVVPDDEFILDSFGLPATPGNVLDITAWISCPAVDVFQNRYMMYGYYGSGEYYCPWTARTEVFLDPVIYYTNHNLGEVNGAIYPVRQMAIQFADEPLTSVYTHVNSAPLIRRLPTTVQYGNSINVSNENQTADVIYNASSGELNMPALFVKGYGSYMGEVDTYTTLSRKYLASLHARCMYQLLAPVMNTKSLT